MWYCSECGHPNEGRFCANCGAEFVDPSAGVYEAPQEPAYQRQQTPPAPPRKKSNKPLIIAIIIAAAVIVLGLIGVISFFALRGNDAAATEGTGIYYYVSGASGQAVLYEDRNIQSQPLAYLQNGAPVEFVEQENNVFYHVIDHSSGLDGYMRIDELVNSLDQVADGGGIETEIDSGVDIQGVYYVTDTKTFLSLRESPSNDANIIAKLYNGYSVGLIDRTSSRYWEVYDYNSGETGYVLKGYLTDDENNVRAGVEKETVTVTKPSSTKIVGDYYVTGTKNYLAIRSQPSSSSTVEIGKSYNGNVVGLIEKTNGTFWYVYDYSSGLYGYVKCAYLSTAAPQQSQPAQSTEPAQTAPSLADDEYIVSGTKNYLAIRSEPSASEDVEIGKTYNGNTVQVIEKTNGTFWYIYDPASNIYGYVKCAYLKK